jgi:hypothetical protein
MDFLQITSILIVLAAAFGAINYLFFKLPSAIGILVVSLLASLGIVVIDALLPDMGIEDTVRTTVTGVDFSQALLEGILGLLLFAGALHVKLSDLQKKMVTHIVDGNIGRCSVYTCFWHRRTFDVRPAAFGCAGLWLSHLANLPCCGVGRVAGRQSVKIA